MGYEKIKELLRYYLQGWVSYFKLADMSGKIKRIDKWLRFRIRMLIWKNWKKIRTK
ncbi:group II intron maturase-specific domain-containing protein [Flavobacterium sp. LAR06]|uniref:group II intron maturase-specific domain-containing protein n=1 Tax=Flavobacterium sp. LAR06 TaxID=3064897 RepID=UPI0035C1CFCD